MEFVLILLMLAAAFYFIIVAPALRSQKSRYTSSRDRNNSSSHQYIRETERPKACPLWGIEISRTQQRRLGKNDPSVIAAKLYRQQLGKFASFQQTRPMADADPNRSSSSATLPRFFQNMFPEEASSTTRRTHRILRKEIHLLTIPPESLKVSSCPKQIHFFLAALSRP
jgi:hypothetical protein